jgi:hypothetical protein
MLLLQGVGINLRFTASSPIETVYGMLVAHLRDLEIVFWVEANALPFSRLFGQHVHPGLNITDE